MGTSVAPNQAACLVKTTASAAGVLVPRRLQGAKTALWRLEEKYLTFACLGTGRAAKLPRLSAACLFSCVDDEQPATLPRPQHLPRQRRFLLVRPSPLCCFATFDRQFPTFLQCHWVKNWLLWNFLSSIPSLRRHARPLPPVLPLPFHLPSRPS